MTTTIVDRTRAADRPHYINGNGLYGGMAKEFTGFAIAEGVSIITSLGVVGLADVLAPGLIKGVSKFVGKHVIEPYLDTIENGLKRVCKLEECQPDESKSREERAQALAKTMIVFSAAWAAGFAAKVWARDRMNAAFGLKGHDGPWWKLTPDAKRVLFADEGVHYGSLLLLNTGMASYTDDMIKATSNMLQKVGMGRRKADELASMGMIWELPNLLGLLAGGGAIAYNHVRDHRERLALNSALSSTSALTHHP